jgi:hypothetical protein
MLRAHEKNGGAGRELGDMGTRDERVALVRIEIAEQNAIVEQPAGLA